MLAAGLAMLASFLYGCVDFGIGRAARTWPNLTIIGVMQLTEVTLALPIAAFFGQPLRALDSWLWIAVLGGLGAALAMLAMVEALSLGPMGLVAPISGCSGAVPVLAGIAVGIPVSALAGVGCLLCMSGIVLLAWEPRKRRLASHRPQTSHRTTVLLSLVSLLAIGGTSVAVAAATARAGTLDAIAALRLTTGCAMAAVIFRYRPRAQVPHQHRLIFVIFALMEFAALLCVSLAYARGSLPVVGLLSALYPVVTVLLAAAILQELLEPRQVAAAGIALLGTGLVAIGAG